MAGTMKRSMVKGGPNDAENVVLLFETVAGRNCFDIQKFSWMNGAQADAQAPLGRAKGCPKHSQPLRSSVRPLSEAEAPGVGRARAGPDQTAASRRARETTRAAWT